MAEKMTKARKKALRYFLENDGAKFRPTDIARITVDRLVASGHLRAERPTFGMVRHFITDSGLRALDEASHDR